MDVPNVPHRSRLPDAPVEDIETEGDRQLKALLKRQLDTDVTLESQLSRKKAFTEPVLTNPIGPAVAGPKTLAQFIANEVETSKLDELRQCGLTDEEIQFKLDANGGCMAPVLKRVGYGLNPAAQADKLMAINEKIQNHKDNLNKPDTFAGAKVMNRHEMELELAISHDRERTKLLGSLVREGRSLDPSYDDMKHPINHLGSILEEALVKRRAGETVHVTESDRGECYKSRPWQSVGPKPLQPVLEATCANKPKQKSEVFIYSPSETESKCIKHQMVETENEVRAGSMQTSDSVESPRTLKVHVTAIPEKAICKYRLSIKEIRNLERFTSYAPGVPNKVLFVKNLSPKITETDLVSLFMRFEKPKSHIEYRLLSGRMKGQAFVTFSDTNTATEALELVNGYHFKGKPVVVQYGRK